MDIILSRKRYLGQSTPRPKNYGYPVTHTFIADDRIYKHVLFNDYVAFKICYIPDIRPVDCIKFKYKNAAFYITAVDVEQYAGSDGNEYCIFVCRTR